MKNTLAYLAFLFTAALSYTSSGQETLTYADYGSSLLGMDSIKVSVYYSGYPTIVPLAPGVWDLTGIIDSVPVLYQHRVAAPPYQYADSNNYSFVGYAYRGNVLTTVHTTGIIQYGIKVYSANYNISASTFDPYDSLFIPGQTSSYVAARTKLALPATYLSAWSSVYKYDIEFELSVAAFSYLHEPGVVRKYVTEYDTVTGWGQMTIKDVTGWPSPQMNVLQVRTRTVTTDSFFLGGSPMPGSLMTTLGLVQGKRDTVYDYSFYRKGEVNPLARVLYRDAGYTQPYKAFKYAQRFVASGIEREDAGNQVRVYPNPVKNKKLNLNLPGMKGKCTYHLIDLAGRMVSSGAEQADHGKCIINLQAAVVPGNYLLHIEGSGVHESMSVTVE